MAVIKSPNDIYEWTRKIQAGLKFRYNKTWSQLKMLIHLKPEEVKSENYDEIIDSLYSRLTQQDEQDKKKKLYQLE